MTSQQKNLILTAVVTAAVSLAGFTTYLYVTPDSDTQKSTTPSTATVSEHLQTTTRQTTDETTSLLNYLIEEEKLAHDIYTKLYEKWGARVFGNILKSESTHQERVLSLLKARDLPDPRKSEVGQFTDKDLQALYDQLLEKGLASERDAYEVGVAIEEKDIADISEILGKVSDSDVISALEDLRRGSENHLRAFNRQL